MAEQADAVTRPTPRRARTAQRIAGDVLLVVVVALVFVVVLNGGLP